MEEMRSKEIIIIAGPSASGKSYLMRKLTTKKKNKFKQEIYRELAIDHRRSKSSISIGALNNLDKKPEHLKKLSKKIIFIHFDLTSRNQDRKRELLLKIAKNCKTVKVLTIKTPFEIWHKRMRYRDQELRTAVPKNNATAIYRNSLFNPLFAKWQYDAVYRQWARFSKNLEAENYLLIKN